jgi:hypothetical protein
MHNGPFLEKVEKIFFLDFFHLKLKIGISGLKNNFRFELSGPRLVGIDAHIDIAIVPKFSQR